MDYKRRGAPMTLLRWIKVKLANSSYIANPNNADAVRAMHELFTTMRAYCRGCDAKERNQNSTRKNPTRHLERFDALYIQQEDVLSDDLATKMQVKKISYWITEINEIALNIVIEERDVLKNDDYKKLLEGYSWGL